MSEKEDAVPSGPSESATATEDTSKQEDGDADTTTTTEQKEQSQTIERHWDHTHRKVIVRGVDQGNEKKVKKILDDWLKDVDGIVVQKIKKPSKETWMVVTLEKEAMIEPFIEFINSGKVKNKKGDTPFAKPCEDGWRKRPLDDSNDDGNADTKRSRVEQIQAARKPVTEDEIKDAITPLWKLSATEQLDSKFEDLKTNCVRKIVREIRARFVALEREKCRKKEVSMYQWLRNKKNAIFLPAITAVPTPVRNKCEFTFGYRYLFEEGSEDMAEEDRPKVPSLGFMAKGWAGGVSPPHCCQNISSEACAIVDIVEAFLKDSPLPPYDSKNHTGIWRVLTVRSSRRTKECMVIIQHAPVTGGIGENDDAVSYDKHFESEKTRLVELLTKAELPIAESQDTLKVTSIFFQEFEGVSSPPPEHPVQHAFGKTYLTEQLGKCSFQISPGAFFQVNTIGAEILYQKVIEKVKEVSEDPKNTLLFDVCCGTGTIGLSCMKEGVVGHVVGVDISEPAIRDAERNAELNGFGSNGEEGENLVRFVAAKAESALSREIGKAKDSEFKFVAVVDPAREGLHPDVVKTLRQNKRISRIVYVSCNPTGSLVNDATKLCAPATKKYPGRAFQVESVCAVDMFPLTKHCEMIMTFDRNPEAEESYKSNS